MLANAPIVAVVVPDARGIRTSCALPTSDAITRLAKWARLANAPVGAGFVCYNWTIRCFAAFASPAQLALALTILAHTIFATAA